MIKIKISNVLFILKALILFRYNFLNGFLVSLRLKSGGRRLSVDRYVTIRNKNNLELGDDCVINSFVHIWAGNLGVKIGDRVLIASHTAITNVSHDYNTNNIRFDPVIENPVIIGNDVWIGTHVTILPGVIIGDGAVIGAGAVVNKNVESNAIVIGVPARTIKFKG